MDASNSARVLRHSGLQFAVLVLQKYRKTDCILCYKALIKENQAQEEIDRLQSALSKLVDEAGIRTRQEVIEICNLLSLFSNYSWDN